MTLLVMFGVLFCGLVGFLAFAAWFLVHEERRDRRST